MSKRPPTRSLRSCGSGPGPFCQMCIRDSLDGKRVQLLDIYYSGVGILHELTPEEMEEAFQQHLTERNKEKTA